MKKTLIIILLLLVVVGSFLYYISLTKTSEIETTTQDTSITKTKVENISRMPTSSQDLNQTYINYSQKGGAAAELLKETSLNNNERGYLLLTQVSSLLDGSPNSLDTDKKNNTLESYRILYSLANDPEITATYRGTAFLAIKQAAYLSGSEEWFFEAVQKYDPETYSRVEKLDSVEKKVLSIKIEYGKKASSLVFSPFNEIELASDIVELALLEKDAAKKMQAVTLSENLYKTWSLRTETVSGYFDGKNLAKARSLEYKTRYLIALSKIKKDTQVRTELETFAPEAVSLLESASLEENPNRARFVSAAFIRILYASYLYETYGSKKAAEIKEIVTPLYGAPKENIPGFLFYLSTHENKASFSSLKKIASFDENFKKLLLSLGWKM